MKGLRAKKSERMKKIHGEFSVAEEEEINPLTLRSESAFDKDSQVHIHTTRIDFASLILTQ